MIEKRGKELWKRMSFKTNKVWAQVDEDHRFVISDDRVRIKYNLDQDYEYQVYPDSIKPVDQAVPASKKTSKKHSKASESTDHPFDETTLPDPCIKIFTDGASSGNPGPSGIGALLIYKDNQKKISHYIGESTNNIAELTAIKVALTQLKRNDLPVRIFSDSSYSIKVLTEEWQPGANRSLINEIKGLIGTFADIEFIKVKGHSGIKENEVADFLATSAIKKGLE